MNLIACDIWSFNEINGRFTCDGVYQFVDVSSIVASQEAFAVFTSLDFDGLGMAYIAGFSLALTIEAVVFSVAKVLSMLK